MAATTDLKDKINTKTLNVVLLSIATAGIYSILWLYRNCRKIEKITGIRTVSDAYIIVIAICAGLGGYFTGTGNEAVNAIGVTLTIVSSVLFIVWAFKARKALMEYCLQSFSIDLKMNLFYTVIFNLYYINYCINALPEVERKQNILRTAKEA